MIGLKGTRWHAGALAAGHYPPSRASTRIRPRARSTIGLARCLIAAGGRVAPQCVVIAAMVYNFLIQAQLQSGGLLLTQGLVLGLNEEGYTHPEI